MIDTDGTLNEPTAVDDVRRIRERFSREAGGDLRKHVEQTQKAFDALREALELKLVSKSAAIK